MSRRLKTWIMLVFALIGIHSVECHAEQAKTHLTIAVLPCTDVVRNFKKFQPLIDYLQQQTGYSIQMLIPNSLAELKGSVENGSIDLVLQDHHTYGMTDDLYSRNSLLLSLTREGSISQRGLIITRKDSGINTIAELYSLMLRSCVLITTLDAGLRRHDTRGTCF